MVILAIGGIVAMLWGITYIIFKLFGDLLKLNIDDIDIQKIAVYIIDMVLIICGVHCGLYGILVAIFFCIAIHDAINVINQPKRYKLELEKKKISDRYDNEYGVIDWEDIK